MTLQTRRLAEDVYQTREKGREGKQRARERETPTKAGLMNNQVLDNNP